MQTVRRYPCWVKQLEKVVYAEDRLKLSFRTRLGEKSLRLPR